MASNVDYALSSSEQIIADLGRRLGSVRLSQNRTQDQIAIESGVGKRTLVRLENGQPSSLDSFVRVLKALGLTANLEALIESAEVRPIERIQNKGQERRRARPTKPNPTGFAWKE